MQFITKKVLFILFVAAFSSWFYSSCKKDDVISYTDAKKQQLSYLADSLRVVDSLNRINEGGLIDYSIQIVSGSTSTMFSPNGGRVRKGDALNKTQKTAAVISGATVTINQYGRKVTDSADASGYVVFKNLLRGGIGVTIRKTGFTDMSYIAELPDTNRTANGTRHAMGNIIPLFETTGVNTAMVTGQATVQTDLTNPTREQIPDAANTTVQATIDASDSQFDVIFLNGNNTPGNVLADYVGAIVSASYGTDGFTSKITGGSYSITAPAAVDGLPIKITYSDFLGTQKVFETGSGSGGSFNQTVTYRQLFGQSITPSAVPAAAGVNVVFAGGAGAAATAVMNFSEVLDQITITNGGSGYSGTPVVLITGGGATGSGAVATATVTAGIVTAISLTSPGSGYTSNPTVSIISGSGATANTTLDNANQSVFAISVTNPGAGYTSVPSVTFTGGGGSGAAGTAVLSNQQVVSVTITSVGSAYTSPPTVSFTGGGGAGAAATSQMGSPLLQVTVTGAGSLYTYAPAVTIGPPDYVGGIQAAAKAVVDANTLVVTGIVITNVGTGYIAPPSVSLNAGSGATATASRVGGSVLSATITNSGTQYYTGAPTVRFVTPAGQGGQGATGTAVVANGKVTSITITAAGSGYTGTPQIVFDDPAGAQGFANIVNGTIGTITIANGGFNYNAAPLVTITPTVGAPGGGAIATATVSGGQVTGVTVTAGGTGYIGGNVPGTAEGFSATNGTVNAGSQGYTKVYTITGKLLLNDVYYGTGQKAP